MPENTQRDNKNPIKFKIDRRGFLVQITSASIGAALSPLLPLALNNDLTEKESSTETIYSESEDITLDILVNGQKRSLTIDPRVTLLDALREKLLLVGTKKGCDHGQCGACTVLMNGKRINSCLCLAVMCQGDEITTIEGLAKGEELHPMQTAFIKHDAFQCGYCTPGQICSAVGLVNEAHAKTDDDIKELMSGNICRCGAYPNILSAVSEIYNNT